MLVPKIKFFKKFTHTYTKKKKTKERQHYKKRERCCFIIQMAETAKAVPGGGQEL